MKKFEVVIETPVNKRQFVTLVEVQDDQTDGDAITIARQEWPAEFKVVSSKLIAAEVAPEAAAAPEQKEEGSAAGGESAPQA